MMAFVQLLVGVLKSIEKVRRNFLQNQDDKTNILHYFLRQQSCLPLHSRGIGIRDLEVFKFAMLGTKT